MLVFDTENLSPKQVRAVSAVVETFSLSDAAEQAGVSLSTLYRWMREPAFMAALREVEAYLLDETVRRLLYMQNKAVQAIEDVLDDANASPMVKLRAAQTVLDGIVKLWAFRLSVEKASGVTSDDGDDWIQAMERVWDGKVQAA